MNDKKTYTKGEFSLTEWEDVNYCEHYFGKGEEVLSDGEVVDLLDKLTKENEQLKQRNNRQCEQLGRLYGLIEEKDWRTLMDIMDDFKRSDEQLQREWGIYSDSKYI